MLALMQATLSLLLICPTASASSPLKQVCSWPSPQNLPLTGQAPALGYAGPLTLPPKLPPQAQGDRQTH